MYDRDILQVSYNSDASKLSRDADYLTHTRVSASSSNQAVAIANTIYNSFSWRRVVVIYTDDIDGGDSFSIFQFRAAQLGIQIINSMMVNAGDDSSDALLELKATNTDPRIFVLLIFDISVARNIIYNGIKNHILDGNNYLVGNAVISNDQLWRDMADVNNDNYQGLKNIMTGYVGVIDAKKDWMVTPNGKAFLQKYRAQPSTMYVIQKCFELLCSLLMPSRLGLCVLRRTYRQDYETLFNVIILVEPHHHYYHYHHVIFI
jgi:ABC-type branched-subunit amino acid transport system substrate-binding protein